MGGMDEDQGEVQGGAPKPKGRETREVELCGKTVTMYVPRSGAVTAAMVTMEEIDGMKNAGETMKALTRLLRKFVAPLFVHVSDRDVVDDLLYSGELELADLLAAAITGRVPDQAPGNRQQRRQHRNRGGRGRGRN